MGCNPAFDGDCDTDEHPQHSVGVPSFVIDRTEVTAAEYKACVQQSGACGPPTTTSGVYGTYAPADKQDHPINFVTWDDAKDYCAWRAWETGDGWRLCTEAEWEKAARGGCVLTGCPSGSDTCCKEAMPKYPWGNAAPSCDSPALAVYHNGVAGCGTGKPWPVGSKPDGASRYGVLDMAGNVLEWVEDWGHTSFDGAPADGTAWVDPPGSGRVYRGGCFFYPAAGARASERHSYAPSHSDYYLGLRCCRSSP